MLSKRNTGAKCNVSWLYQAFAPIVEIIDRQLRARLGVVEFSNSPDCLFRLQIIENEADLLLDDGTALRAGDRLVDLHFWNEQVPVMPDGGPTLAFARKIERCLDISLSELARYLSEQTHLADIKAIRGNMSLGASQRSQQVARIAARHGFIRLEHSKPLSFSERLHRIGENILITLLVMGRNPRAVKMDTLWRDRTLTYLSRKVLEQRYRR